MEADQNNSGASVPNTHSSKPTTCDRNKPKILVTIKPNGQPVGEQSVKFITRLGKLIRVHCPISYSDWRVVPSNFKDDLWNALMFEYEFNAPSQLVRSNLADCFPQKFRTYKYALRKKYLVGKSKEEALAACPNGTNPGIWNGFVTNEFKQHIRDRRVTNVENRNKNKIRHTLGWCSYANKSYILEKKECIVINGRADLWMKGHEKKDGTVHPSAVETYEKVKTAKEKRKNTSEEGCSSQPDLDSDELVEVFGQDNGKGNVRAYSSYVSQKRAKQAYLASYLIESSVDKCKAPFEAKLDKFECRVEGWMKMVMEQLQSQKTSQVNVDDGTHSIKVGSNSTHRTCEKDPIPVFEEEINTNITSGSRVSENSYVNLLNRNGVVVASGYIVTGEEGVMCHNRKVLPGEKKVRVEIVYEVSAAVPNPPQGEGHFTLGGFSEGGWLIWSEARL